MPEIQEAYQNEPNFADVTWESDNIFIADSSYIALTVYCSSACTMAFHWKIDGISDAQIETKSVLSNVATTMYSPVLSRYVIFSVDGFNSSPCSLKTQAFIFQ